MTGHVFHGLEWMANDLWDLGRSTENRTGSVVYGKIAGPLILLQSDAAAFVNTKTGPAGVLQTCTPIMTGWMLIVRVIIHGNRSHLASKNRTDDLLTCGNGFHMNQCEHNSISSIWTLARRNCLRKLSSR